MTIELVKEKYAGAINTVEIGVGPAVVKIGGQTALPFLFEEGAMPNPPRIALEVWDCEPLDWPQHIREAFGDSLKDPVAWAARCVSDFSAKILCVRLASVHDDWGGRKPDEAVSTLRKIAKETNLPLIIIGCGDDDKDSELLPKASQALKGEGHLFGVATQNSYKTLTATCLADSHSIIAESPIDVNIAKQLNILISDMGFDPRKIVMHPTTASLGYGMEYVYSIMERARLAAFMGDKMLSMPFILFTGQEVWKMKEANPSTELRVRPERSRGTKEFSMAQGVNWEMATAVAMLQAGADLLVMRHPEAATSAAKYIEEMMK